jgi:hypothetical protein
MVRVRVLLPTPQLLEQAPQEPHAVTLQSMGQSALEHWRLKCVAGHALPPFVARFVTLRMHLVIPRPQDCGHAKQSHAETAQSLGQLVTAQARDSESTLAAQGVPPCCAAASTLRARDCVPPPHVVVQGLQSPNDESMQWAGHGMEPHSRFFSSAGHT